MTKKELMDAMWQTALTSSRASCESLWAMIVKKIAEKLTQQHVCNLPGLGRFKIMLYGTRQARNPQTGKNVNVAPSARVTFKAGSDLQRAMNAIAQELEDRKNA